MHFLDCLVKIMELITCLIKGLALYTINNKEGPSPTVAARNWAFSTTLRTELISQHRHFIINAYRCLRSSLLTWSHSLRFQMIHPCELLTQTLMCRPLPDASAGCMKVTLHHVPPCQTVCWIGQSHPARTIIFIIFIFACLQEGDAPVHAVLGGPEPDVDTVAATLCLALHLNQVM